jgi:hypothetical protein
MHTCFKNPHLSGLNARPLPDGCLQAETVQEPALGAQLAFCDARHDISLGTGHDKDGDCAEGLVSRWRQKERLKTTAVALVVCLNIGVDPPDVIKISPCARLECWVDPLSMQAPKALDTIGEALLAFFAGGTAARKPTHGGGDTDAI